MAQSTRLHRCEPLGELTLVLTDDAGICDVHDRCFGDNTTTDVISLNYEAIPGDAGGASGEIFVNTECAARNARHADTDAEKSRGRWTASRELALYVAHGCDHLGGGTDETDITRARMRQRELRWLRVADQDGLLDFPLMTPAH